MSKPNNKSKPSHKFDIGGDFGISGTLQFVNGLASNSKERKANEETYNNAIDNTRIGFNSISSLNNLDSLEDYINSSGQLHELETSDLIGNNAHRIGKFLSTSSQAMQAGSNFGPWGALAGAIVGQIGAGIAGRRNRKKAESAISDLNEKIRQTNALQTAMVDNKLNNIMANQIADQQWDYINALGGNLHSNSTTWSNGLNYIGSGGSHESNPNDGVAISTAPDGLQNKVEEGEVVWNDDYVFSRRLKVPKKDLEKNKWKGETYADIAKKLMDESAERPNDPITLRGLDDSLSRLKDSQEELKAKQEGNKIKKEIASIPPELLAQMQQAQQQPTEEEIMQQQTMEQMSQEQMPMVDPSMQQPMMEQPPMYAKGGHLFNGITNVTGNIYTWGDQDSNIAAAENYITNNSQKPITITQKYPKIQDDTFGRPTDNVLSQQKPNNNTNGINKGALFGALASGIDMTGAVIDNVWGNSGGNLDALYKGKRDNKDLPNWLTTAWNGYTGGLYAKGGHLHALGDPIRTVESGYYKDNTELLKDPYRGYSMADLQRMLPNYPQVQDEINKRNNFLKTNALINEDNKNAAIQAAERDGMLRLLTDKIARESASKNNTLYDYWKNAVNEANYQTYLSNLSNLKPPITQSVYRQPEGEVENETEAEILNDKNLLLRAKEKYYPKSLTREERKELRKNKKEVKEENTKDRNFNFDPTYMRYAPVLGSIFNVARSIASRPDYGNPERIERAAARVGAQVSPRYIGDYLRYRPLDEAYYLNQLNAQQNAANNAIVGLSNGNRSMALASMLANDYNYNNQRGAAYRQGLEYNEAQRQRAAEFNRGTNQFNAQQYMQAAAQNASNRAQAANLISAAAQMREGIDNAYGASQSANWTNLFNNIGNVGKDEANRKMTKDLFDYGWGKGFNKTYNGATFKHGGYLTIKTNNRRKE